jgi:hypothetical protein
VKVKRSGGKPVLPKRICRDPQTKYCLGHKNSRKPWGHRGCCDCLEWNAGDHDPRLKCSPYLLPEEVEKLKQWWLANDLGPWEDDDHHYTRPKMKRRGGRQ